MKTAFLFSGQGAQFVGMGCDLYEKYDTFKKIYEEAGEHLKIDLYKICSDEQTLSKTENAQAAIFAMSYAEYRLLGEHNIKPKYMAGFSLGEITSLAASGMLSFVETLDLISIRGKTMQKACNAADGAMFGIIGASDGEVEEVCEAVSKKYGYVTPANYNCPKQIVISGESEAAEKAADILAEKKYKTVKLKVNGAFHSKLMKCGENEFAGFLKSLNLKKPEIDLYSNITGNKFDFGNDIKSFMVDYIPNQMSSPVRFKNEIENISAEGCDMFVEIGPGRTLSGFVKKTIEDAKFSNAQDVESFEKTIEMFK